MKHTKRSVQRIALALLLTFGYEICFPTVAWALTSGPSQPEVQSFEPVGTTEMVDLSTGDFNYNIPLLDIEGYPINIAYHAGVSMDQEASWVGLGWNINPGSINRNMRGLPDDFSGDDDDPDMITKEFNMKPVHGYGVSQIKGFEILGKDLESSNFGLYRSMGINYHSYKGIGYEFDITAGVSSGILAKSGLDLQLGLSANSQEGFGVDMSLSYNVLAQSKEKGAVKSSSTVSISAETSFNSRAGLSKMGYGISFENIDKQLEKIKSNSRNNPFRNIVSVGSVINFGTRTYLPSASFSNKTSTTSFQATGGLAMKTVHPNVGLRGYETYQDILFKKESKKAYGYLYTHLKDEDNVILDFNREGEGVLSENTSRLPLSNYTYDIYSVSGQGIGAQFRPYRSDVNILHDDRRINTTSSSTSQGVKFGVTSDSHFGATSSGNTVEGGSGAWTEGNKLWSIFGYSVDYTKATNAARPEYEAAYMKNVGELTPIDEDFYAVFGNDKVVRPFLSLSTAIDDPSQRLGRVVIAENKLLPDFSNEINPVGVININLSHKNNVRQKRQIRNQYVQYLNGRHAKKMALEKMLNSHSEADNEGKRTSTKIDRVGEHRKNHHISEIIATNTDGARYVYGIPAYNIEQNDYTFSVDEHNTKDLNSGLVVCDATDISTSNNKGFDNYYQKTSTPAYSYSHLLTAVLSPDYVDVTGNGVTFDDDLGTAMKINYEMVHPEFKWRTPIGKVTVNNSVMWLTANLSKGFINDNNDDKAVLITGKKEVWYVTSIETKNYIAEFTLSDRADGLGAKLDGTIDDTRKLKKIDKITLYSRKDRELNKENAVPIKTIHFEYDYSLCPSVPNNSGVAVNKRGEILSGTNATNPDLNVNIFKGKLTLKKIYFTYGKSNKAALSPYRFTYSSTNPSYDSKGYDRWGTYRPNSSTLRNDEFPYVKQWTEKSISDAHASAWALTQIQLPSGGKISVEYESDSYAFVQHKRAMEMTRIIGAGYLENNSAQVFDKLYSTTNEHYECLFFEVGDISLQEFHRAFFYDDRGIPISLLAFNFLVDLKADQANYEYVKGYAEVKTINGLPDAGLVSYTSGGNTRNIGYVKIKKVAIGDNENANTQVSPIVKTTWQFARLQKPSWVHPGSNPNETGESAIRGLLGAMGEINTLWKSFNRTLQNRGYARNFIPSKSFIRLYSPSFHKIGGGHRVKKISIADNWMEMNTSSDQRLGAVYGQEYDYTTTEQIHKQDRVISSGVASYEPFLGNDENPWRMPIFNTIENLMAPDEKYYSEEPFGESFFPYPTVVYSKISVKNIKPVNESTKIGTGKVVHEFYTSRDYPTITTNTANYKIRQNAKKALPTDIEDYITMSQGYLVELNDMHGKPKAQWVYAESAATPQSGIEYIYRSKREKSPNKLDNKVNVYDKNTNIVLDNKEIGTEIDFYMDSRESKLSSVNAGIQLSTDVVFFGVTPPLPFPMTWPSHSSERVRARTITATKIVSRFGILEKTIAYENGAKLTSENILYDAETGNVLLTKTQNEFEDNVFHFNYPAHFAYEGMANAYKNIGAVFHNIKSDVNGITLSNTFNSNPEYYFQPGDEVMITSKIFPALPNSPYAFQKGWIHRSGINNQLVVINRNGKVITIPETPKHSVTIIRSGRRNLQNWSIGEIITLKNPIVNSSGNYVLNFDSDKEIVNANVTTYSEKWNMLFNQVQSKVCNYNESQLSGLIHETMTNDLFITGHINNINAGFYNANIIGTQLAQLVDNTCPDNGTYKWHILPTETMLSNGLKKFQWKIKLCKEKTSGGMCCVEDEEDVCKNFVIVFDYVGETKPEFAEIQAIEGMPFAEFTPVNPDDISNTALNKIVFNFRLRLLNSNNWYHAKWSQSSDDFLRPETPICTNCSTTCSPINFNTTIVNPYIVGILGNWRLKSSYVYDTKRKYSTPLNVRKDGTYETFSPFWVKNNAGIWDPVDNNPWLCTNTITQYTSSGAAKESKDALNRYSTILYSASNQPIAVASNARIRQIAYESFEDVPYTLKTCETDHWSFKSGQTTTAQQDATYAHTGLRSFKLSGNSSHMVTSEIYSNSNPTNCTQNTTSYILKPCDLSDIYNPDSDLEYIFSGWVKQTVANPALYPDDNVYVEIIIPIPPTTPPTSIPVPTPPIKVIPTGPVIEGWRRMEAKFTIPENNNRQISIRMVNDTSTNAWFDDFRIMPAHSQMKTSVYHPTTLRLMADLDENNFATFYEYDQQGAVARVKKETIKGIVTLKSTRSSTSK